MTFYKLMCFLCDVCLALLQCTRLSALQCFPSLCLSLLSSLMISTAVIINSLIWCQHSLVHSPDVRARNL